MPLLSTPVNLTNSSATITTTPTVLYCLGKKVNGKISCISLANSNDVLNVSLARTDGGTSTFQVMAQQSYTIQNIELEQIVMWTNISTATVSYSFTLNEPSKDESIMFSDVYSLQTVVTNTADSPIPVSVMNPSSAPALTQVTNTTSNPVPISKDSMYVSFFPGGQTISALTTTNKYSIGGRDRAVFFAYVSSVSGTSPTLNITVQGYSPETNSFVNIQSFPAITATGPYTLYINQLGFDQIALYITVSGTSASFSLTVEAWFKYA